MSTEKKPMSDDEMVTIMLKINNAFGDRVADVAPTFKDPVSKDVKDPNYLAAAIMAEWPSLQVTAVFKVVDNRSSCQLSATPFWTVRTLEEAEIVKSDTKKQHYDNSAYTREKNAERVKYAVSLYEKIETYFPTFSEVVCFAKGYIKKADQSERAAPPWMRMYPGMGWW